MGLLDDAIKEHLELKRKHGAAEEELRRQESEALGPARRDFTPEPGAAPESEALGVESAAPLPGDDASGDYAVAPQPAGWLDDEPGGGPFGSGEEPPPEPLEHAAEAADPALAQEPLAAADPVPAADAVRPREDRPEPSQTPTEGFDALSRDDEPRPAAEGAAEGEEDVLEETPDFLQETPEHDRLWFEQKPPRDFDFDG